MPPKWRGRGGSKPPSARGRNKSNGPRGPAPRRVTPGEIIERGIPGFRALKYTTKLNYYDAFQLSTGAGSVGTYVFSANGLYDPNITGTGHQPMPFDQLMLSYEHYCVLKSRITVRFSNLTAVYLSVSISINAGATPVTSNVALVENGNLVRESVSSGSYHVFKVLEMPINISTFGSVKSIMSNPDYKGTISANPVEQSYFHVSVWDPINVAVSTVECEVFIEYLATFFEPRKNSVSLNRKITNLIKDELYEEIESKTPFPSENPAGCRAL